MLLRSTSDNSESKRLLDIQIQQELNMIKL